MGDLLQLRIQIQVLNQLLGLLVMQLNPNHFSLKTFDWENASDADDLSITEREPMGYGEYYENEIFKLDKLGYYLIKDEEILAQGLSLIDAWNHPITQKEWGDQIVLLAKKFNTTEYNTTFFDILLEINTSVDPDCLPKLIVYDEYAPLLDAILNRYGRSLNENI